MRKCSAILFVMLASNTLIGLATWLALKQLGLEHAGVWGFAAGVLDFVPYLGTLVVAIAAGIAAFLQFGTIILGLAAAGITMVIAGMIDQVFVTWLHSRLTRVNAAVLFIALLFFGWLWGIAGLLLSAPLVAIGKVICDRVDALKPVGDTLGALNRTVPQSQNVDYDRVNVCSRLVGLAKLERVSCYEF